MSKVEEYIEVIMKLQEEKGMARTVEIARKIGVSPATVSEMLQRLEAEDYVIYQPYYGARLSRKGRNIAKRLAKREEMLFEFLIFTGIDERRAKAEAAKMKYCMKPSTINRLYALMKFLRDEDTGKTLIARFEEMMRGDRK